MPDRQLNWDITGTCNLYCTHCYAYDKYEWRKPRSLRVVREDLPVNDSKAMLRKARAMGFTHVHLLGGEPLLRRDLLDILAFARRELDLKITMNTNGTLLKPALIDALIDLEIYQVAVSFEGTTAEIHDQVRGAGNFEKARRNLKELGERVIARGSPMLVGVGYVLTRAGLGDIHRAFQFALDHFANGLLVDVVSEDGRAREVFDQLGYSDEDMLTALEGLLEDAAGRVPPGFIFQLNVKPRVRRYLSERYGMRLIGEGFGDACPAGEHSMLVENDGVTTPCGILNKKSKNQQAVGQGCYRPERMSIFDFDKLEDMQASTFYASFIDFKRRHQGTVPTCRTCEFRSTCQPCPVDYLDSAEVGQCAAAESRRTAWRAELERRPLSLRWDDPRGLNETGQEIVSGLAAGETLQDLARRLADGDDGFETAVSDDIWGFAMELRAAGLLDVPAIERSSHESHERHDAHERTEA